MVPNNTTEQLGQPALGKALAELAQCPLTRLQSVPIPAESNDAGTAVPTAAGTAVPTAEEQRPRLPVRVRVPFFPPSNTGVASDGISVLQQWQGTVSEVNGDEVTGVLRDWTDPTKPDEEVTVSIQEFSPDDQPLLAAGTVFYWSIGYRTRRGTRERVSSFQLRRTPAPSAAQRARAREDGAVLARLLGSTSR